MEKWNITLSTTEPYNHVGEIKVRKGNVNSETMNISVVQNHLPLDLSGLTVYFCNYQTPFIAVEQQATVVDAKNGILQYTLNQHDMQGKLRFAYFKFMRGEELVATTQNFSYTIIDSIDSSCVNAGSYIQRLEDVLNAFGNAKDDATKEIQQIIDSFNEQVLQQQKEFDVWFGQVEEIIESIDPGGILLNEIIALRDGEKSAHDRLIRDQKVLEGLRYSEFYDETFENIGERFDKVEKTEYCKKTGEINVTRTLIDDAFTSNHVTKKIAEVQEGLILVNNLFLSNSAEWLQGEIDITGEFVSTNLCIVSKDFIAAAHALYFKIPKKQKIGVRIAQYDASKRFIVMDSWQPMPDKIILETGTRYIKFILCDWSAGEWQQNTNPDYVSDKKWVISDKVIKRTDYYPIVIATISDPNQGRFYFEKVGEI